MVQSLEKKMEGNIDISKKNNIQIFLGKNEDMDFRQENVYWNPLIEQNPHLVISGMSGSGKTETLRRICHELKKSQIPVLIFDFHNDFTNFAENLIDEDNLNIHPLSIMKGEKPKDVAHKVSSILANSFKGLTIYQEGVIRKAILEFYKDSGIDNLDKPNEGEYKLLPFREFKDYFALVCPEKRTAESLKIKLDILFDYDLFSKSDNKSLNLGDLIGKSTVFQLKKAPSDEVKKVVAEIMISKLIQYAYLLEQTKKIRLYCIIDEAHRMVYQGSPLDKLFRESRKYGIGVILASQRASDFNEVVLSNVGAVMTLKQNLHKDARHIAKNYWAEKEVLLRARKGEAYLKMTSQNRPLHLQIEKVKYIENK